MFKLQEKSDDATVRIEIANGTVLRVMLVVILSLAALAAARQARHALMMVFTAFFLTLALNGPVHWLAHKLPGKRRGSRSLATTISFFVVIVLLLGFLASIVPPLVRQTSKFISAVPGIVNDSRDQETAVGQFIRKYKLESQVDNFSDQLSDRLKHISGEAVKTTSTIGSSIFSMLTILVLTFMMLVEGPKWLVFFKRIVPEEHQSRVQRMALDMYKVVRGYVNGQVMLAFIASLMILPVMLLLNIDYALALAVVVFICGLIPIVGHTFGAIIVTGVALTTSPVAAAIILAYYILYQQIENYVVQPKIQSNTTNMSPLLVFVSVVVGVSFGGIFGGLVAIPIAGCIRILLVDYMRFKKILPAEQPTEAK